MCMFHVSYYYFTYVLTAPFCTVYAKDADVIQGNVFEDIHNSYTGVPFILENYDTRGKLSLNRCSQINNGFLPSEYILSSRSPLKPNKCPQGAIPILTKTHLETAQIGATIAGTAGAGILAAMGGGALASVGVGEVSVGEMAAGSVVIEEAEEVMETNDSGQDEDNNGEDSDDNEDNDNNEDNDEDDDKEDNDDHGDRCPADNLMTTIEQEISLNNDKALLSRIGILPQGIISS